MHPRIQLQPGERLGRLVVERIDPASEKVRRWICRCDCGATTSVEAVRLKRRTRSCGCIRRENLSARNRTHGHSKTPEHIIWCAIKARCENPNNKVFAYYGGRGIAVCDQWRNSFKAFIEDMGPRPHPDLTIDRIDNDGPYSPENCRWATRKEQSQNSRRVRTITCNGVTKTTQEWASETGVSAKNILQRINKLGWTPERALSTP